jgi:pyroglutamyl-peptidase
LVSRLLRLRRPAFADLELWGHIFPVTYEAVDRELPQLLARHRPHALLMFGLANRTPYVRIETRARNAVTTLWPDADHARVRKGSIHDGAGAMMFGPHTTKLLRAAVGTGVDARSSRDAGSYLCNYLSWRAIESTRDKGPALAAFVHIPGLARDIDKRRCGSARRVSMEELGRCRRSHAAGIGEADEASPASGARFSGRQGASPRSAGAIAFEPHASLTPTPAGRR